MKSFTEIVPLKVRVGSVLEITQKPQLPLKVPAIVRVAPVPPVKLTWPHVVPVEKLLVFWIFRSWVMVRVVEEASALVTVPAIVRLYKLPPPVIKSPVPVMLTVEALPSVNLLPVSVKFHRRQCF